MEKPPTNMMIAFSFHASDRRRNQRSTTAIMSIPRGGIFLVRLDLFFEIDVARRTDAVTELRLEPLGDIGLDLRPVLIVPADALAVAADRQEPVQLLDVGQRVLQF